MAKLNRTCQSCKTKYSYCPSCSRADALKPTWYSEFCSETCMTLWTTATKLNMDMLTKEEAKDIISNLDLKPIDAYAACIQRDYAKIMESDKKLRKIKRPEPVVELIASSMDVIEQQDPIVEAEPVMENEPLEIQIEQPVVAEFVNETLHEVVYKENE